MLRERLLAGETFSEFLGAEAGVAPDMGDGEWPRASQGERYRQVRTWYARDHGKTAVNELLELIAKAEAMEERAKTTG